MTVINGFDILHLEYVEIYTEEITQVSEDGLDFIVTTEHWGAEIPTEALEHRALDPLVLIDTDLYIDDIWNMSGGGGLRGVQIHSNSNPFFVNISRPRNSYNDERGVMPTKFLGGEIDLLKKPYSMEQVERFLSQFYDPHHAAIQKYIKLMKQEHGYALLFDGHSMSSCGLGADDHPEVVRPNFIVGTRGNTTADPRLVEVFANALRQKSREYNLPIQDGVPESAIDGVCVNLKSKGEFVYGGGFITSNYGNPKNGVHAIQVETRKDLYLNETLSAKEINPQSFASVPSALGRLNEIIIYAVTETVKKAQEIFKD